MRDVVVVPPEVHDGLQALERADALDPDDRQRAVDAASEMDLSSTVRWLERVGPGVYQLAASGGYASGDEA